MDDTCRVDMIQDWIRVALVTSCEDNDLEMFGQSFE